MNPEKRSEVSSWFTGKIVSKNSSPNICWMRVGNPCPPGKLSSSCLLCVSRKWISGLARDFCKICSWICWSSVAVVFRNFNLAGVLKKRRSTVTFVPFGNPILLGFSRYPPLIRILVPPWFSSLHVSNSKWETDAIEASASPRNPSVLMRNRSSSLYILLVACLSTASWASDSLIPHPLSRMEIRSFPPFFTVTCTSVAPASMAFSSNSLTTEAGRSTTSPAAILLIKVSGSIWIFESMEEEIVIFLLETFLNWSNYLYMLIWWKFFFVEIFRHRSLKISSKQGRLSKLLQI